MSQLPAKVKVTAAKIGDLVPDDSNANEHTEFGMGMLARSIERVGLIRSISLDKNNRIIGGNATHETAGDMGVEEVVIVEVPGNVLVAVKRKDLDLDTEMGREAAVLDNRTGQLNLRWSAGGLLRAAQQGVQLDKLFGKHDLKRIVERAANEAQQASDVLQEDVDTQSGELGGESPKVLDIVYPSDNDLEIPTLDLRMQATDLVAPFVIWGSQRRTAEMTGTYAFYCDDYRFEAIWKDPGPLVASRCQAVVEPNFTMSPAMPMAMAVYHIYRKRWLARWWQSQGVRVFVDLNVVPKFHEANLLGVPKGWSAYATHGADEMLHQTQEEYAIAQGHSGKSDPLFLVYGGGRATRIACRSRGWLHIEEDFDRAKAGTKERTDRGEQA